MSDIRDLPKSSSDTTPNYSDRYEPKIVLPKTKFSKFWGTRGSIPVSGLEHFRYGGNTVCLEVRDEDKTLIFDAGTGIRPLGDDLMKTSIREVHLFIGHTHWDHIMGFPFFSPIYSPEFTVHIYAHTPSEKKIENLFKGFLAEDFFPVTLDEMSAEITFHSLDEKQSLEIGSYKVDLHPTNHPGSGSCFKISYQDYSIGYATDNEFLQGYVGHPNKIERSDPRFNDYNSLIDFFSDCDRVVHEAQYTPKEYQTKVGWGHTSVANAAILMKYCQAKEWILTHHDPSHSDELLIAKLDLQKEVLEDCQINCKCFMAFDGLTLPMKKQ